MCLRTHTNIDYFDAANSSGNRAQLNCDAVSGITFEMPQPGRWRLQRRRREPRLQYGEGLSAFRKVYEATLGESSGAAAAEGLECYIEPDEILTYLYTILARTRLHRIN